MGNQIFNSIDDRNTESDTETQIDFDGDSKPKITDDFKVFVGIDFGTDGVGISYTINKHKYPDLYKKLIKCMNTFNYGKKLSNNNSDNKMDSNEFNDDNVIIMHEWEKSYVKYAKQKAYILLNEQNELISFGNDASTSYEINRKQNWKFFDKFKMSLFDPYWLIDRNDDEKMDSNSNIDRIQNRIQADLKEIVTDKQGNAVKSSVVFIHALKYLKEMALNFIKGKRYLDINDIKLDDIQFILTIPSIWSPKAKNLMKNWAIKAGLVNPKISNHLIMVLEPDCVSLQIQHEFRNTFKNNDKYIIIDAGGGTVDIIAHQVINNFGAKEIAIATGGPFGSTYIDDEIIKIIYKLFGKYTVIEYQKQCAKDYAALIQNCVWAKTQFYDIDYETQKEKYHSILIPMRFLDYICQKLNLNQDEIERKIDNTHCNEYAITDLGNTKAFKFNTDMLSIHYKIWEHMFNKSILPIIDQCDRLISKVEGITTESILTALNNTANPTDDSDSETDIKYNDSNSIDNDIDNSKVKYIVLAGGLSQSKYFIKQIKDAFQRHTIIPENPILCVCKGAARFGITKNFIQSRILTKSFGIETIMKLNVLKNDHPKMHKKLRKSGYLRDNVIKSKVLGLLDIMHKKGDEISLNAEPLKLKYYRQTESQTKCQIKVYCSNNDNPITINDAKKIASFDIYFNRNNNDLGIIVEISWKQTLLEVFAYPINNIDNANKTRIPIQYNYL